MSRMTPGLAEILDLEQIEVLVFRGRSRRGRGTRVFGGEVAGQALVAAGRTVPADRRGDPPPAPFLPPGGPPAPPPPTPDAVRGGRPLPTRRGVAAAHGEGVLP